VRRFLSPPFLGIIYHFNHRHQREHAHVPQAGDPTHQGCTVRSSPCVTTTSQYCNPSDTATCKLFSTYWTGAVQTQHATTQRSHAMDRHAALDRQDSQGVTAEQVMSVHEGGAVALRWPPSLHCAHVNVPHSASSGPCATTTMIATAPFKYSHPNSFTTNLI
jgi:hypothetical protein